MEFFDLLHTMVKLQGFLINLDFPLLEGAYFSALWHRVPPAYKTTMLAGIRQRLQDAEQRCSDLKALYRQTLVPADAIELAETQLRFPIQQATDLMHRLFPESCEG